MIALSIRQPWASLIMSGDKNIENREWPTRFRGRFLVHASKSCTRAEFAEAIDFAEGVLGRGITADLKTIHRGGIIGSVELVDCVERSDSPWFVGLYGFVLRDPQMLPFTPWKGQLGFFDVPQSSLISSSPNTTFRP